ncbi:phenylalanine--tRNA ligase subunit beta [Clostridiaceae bacterium HFYG-1003]|nr:phenylalanine--tRNA ligase subunit beta [Clostridiaceae bacterium HFYG-1003]
MLVSLNWIREYVDLPADLTMEKLSYDLTMRTVEVEGTYNPADGLDHIVAGKILEVKPHPQADRLRLVLTDIGRGEPVQIVCGGSNLAPGQMIVAALPGSFVRWHGEGEPVAIQKSKLRGEESFGMICGASEVGRLEELLPPKAETEIMDITAFDAVPGQPIADILGLDDIILEIDNKSMTNRPDLWGHYGLARELASIYQMPLKTLPRFAPSEGIPSFPVVIEDPSRCMRYSATHITNLEVAPSPWELQLKLWKVGMRPINNIVDMTNYVMLATGQPTHGFDYSHVKEGIQVRAARPGETLELLDGRILDLKEHDLLICDSKDPLGLAGIMGGLNDSILPQTTEMILEVASFESTGIRKTTQVHGLRTEASMRFEKAINTQRVDEALGVFQSILSQTLPEARIVAYHDEYPNPTQAPVIDVQKSFLNTRLGQEISTAQMSATLAPLGFSVEDAGESFRVLVPHWRATGDVSLRDDVLEEVARMIGYENFEFTPPTISLDGPVNQKKPDLERQTREYLAFRCGLQEVFTYPWIDESYVRAAGEEPSDLLRLSAPPSPETAGIRNSLIPGLLEAIEKNSRYVESFQIFEMTQVFRKDKTFSPSDPSEVLPVHEKHLGIALVGDDPERLFRKLKGILENLPRVAMAFPLSFSREAQPAWADRKAWLNLTCDGQTMGSMGLLSMKSAQAAGIKRVYAALAELNFDMMIPYPSRDNTFRHLPTYPLVEQDLSMLLDEQVTWHQIEQAIKDQVRDLKFIEEYRGTQIPEAKKSLTLRLWIGSDEKTLSASDIEAMMNQIISTLRTAAGAEIRDK